MYWISLRYKQLGERWAQTPEALAPIALHPLACSVCWVQQPPRVFLRLGGDHGLRNPWVERFHAGGWFSTRLRAPALRSDSVGSVDNHGLIIIDYFIPFEHSMIQSFRQEVIVSTLPIHINTHWGFWGVGAYKGGLNVYRIKNRPECVRRGVKCV